MEWRFCTEEKIANEVYKKRRTIDMRIYVHQCRMAELKRWNVILTVGEIALFLFLFFLFFIRSKNIVLIGIVSIFIFVLLLIQRFWNLEKLVGEENLKTQLFVLALVRLDRQIAFFKLENTSFEDQLLWLDNLFLIDNFMQLPMKKWYHYQLLYTRDKKEGRSRVAAEESRH